ncbi:MAG TPA: TIGR01777 family oxidoreductase [Solirubrobacteraceae bacterium]|nr:TIGR01777 family oxidoreductase [Solirubrobacteraceae bacterium]
MRVVLTGATGTVGRALAGALTSAGEQVVALSRDADRGRSALGRQVEVAQWRDPSSSPPPAAALSGADAVVNLLGEPVAQRWSDAAKARIRDSRVLGTRSLVEGLRSLPEDARPRTLVSQSATGFYGPRGNESIGEDAAGGSDFLAGVVAGWEREALAATELGIRVVTTRTGVVLSAEGGALAKMLPFFRLGVGGPVAGGRQYVPWIHMDDVVEGIRFCLAHAEARGAVNVTAPNPVTNGELSRALGRVLHRPALLPVPAFALRLLYGEMSEIVTTGQRVIPERLASLGYPFRFPEIEPALRDVLA